MVIIFMVDLFICCILSVRLEIMSLKKEPLADIIEKSLIEVLWSKGEYDVNNTMLDTKVGLSIALCTYNGSSFLKEQLNSLARQTYKPMELVVCDDCSSDDTLCLVKEFAKNAPFVVRIIENKVSVGPVKNFSQAILACSEDYVALCDQDDVWLENKLELLLNKMMEIEAHVGSNVPLLVHSDLVVTDEKLQPVFFSMMEQQHIRNETDMQNAQRVLSIQNYVTGCTVLINRTLVESACPIPTNAVMHDWWLALIAASKGYIGFVEQPLVYYRQHKSNTVGAVMNRPLKIIRDIFDIGKTRDKLLKIMLQDDAAVGCEVAQDFVVAIIEKDIKGIIKLGVHKQSRWLNIGAYIMLFFFFPYYREALKALKRQV